MQLARAQCGIKSTARMADLLEPVLGKKVAASTVSAWESGRNQPSRGGVRMEHVVTAWAKVCTDEATRLNLGVVVTPGWLWGATNTGATSSDKPGIRRSGALSLAASNPRPAPSRNLGSPLVTSVTP